MAIDFFVSNWRKISFNLESVVICELSGVQTFQELYLWSSAKNTYIVSKLNHLLELFYLLLRLRRVNRFDWSQRFKVFIEFLRCIVLEQLFLILNFWFEYFVF